MDFWQDAPGLRDNGQEERACEQIAKSLFGNYEGRCFRGKGRMAGATKEALRAATTEQLRKHSRAGRSQTAFSAKTLRAAGLLSVAGVGSFLTARCGDARNSPPWPQPKSLAAAPLVVSKQALRFRASILGWSGGTGGEARDFYSWLTARLIWLSSPPQLPLRKRNKFMDNQKTNSMAGGDSRRNFIKQTAPAAAAVATTSLVRTPVYGQSTAPSTGRVIGANDRIIVGYIGVGGQGMAHVRSMKEHASENNIVQAAVCDVWTKRIEAAKATIGGD